jgi:tetratricopeptide (TPR) repeat protein
LWEILNILSLLDSFSTKKSALEKYEKKLNNYKKQEAEIITKMGIIYLEDDQFEEALQQFHEALKIYKKMGYFEGEAFAHDLIGDTHLSSRNLSKALQHYQDSFKIYSSIKSPQKTDLFEKIKDVEKVQEAMELLKEKSKRNNLKENNQD